jgi:hypothetical protein
MVVQDRRVAAVYASHNLLGKRRCDWLVNIHAQVNVCRNEHSQVAFPSVEDFQSKRESTDDVTDRGAIPAVSAVAAWPQCQRLWKD